MLKITLCDVSEELVNCWRIEFKKYREIKVKNENLFQQQNVDAIVSPGNSFGLMDAGLDRLMCERFGNQLEQKLQKNILHKHNGELLVGKATIIETEDKDIPYFISSPTMRVPMKIENTPNVYLATRAIFITIDEFNSENLSKIRSVIIPGMGVGSGKMPYMVAAKQMRKAYENIILNRCKIPEDWKIAIKEHKYLVTEN